MGSRRPPGPRGRIGTGNGRDYERDRIGFLSRCQQEYGDVFRFSDASTVVLDPTLIQKLHARTNAEFVSERATFAGRKRSEWLMGTISTTMNNRRSQWRGVNRLESATRSDVIVSAFDRVMSDIPRSDVDVHDVMMRVSGYSVTEFCMGGDGEDVTPIVEAIDAAVRATMVIMNRPTRVPAWFPLPSVRRMLRAGRVLRSRMEERVARRNAQPNPDEPRDLLDRLLEGDNPDLDNIAMMLSLMLRASYAVPGAAITWAVRQLALEPEVAQRLRAEADDIDDPADGQRPYAEAVVKELLRMYPPSWLGGREVRESTTLGEWDFEAGEQIMFTPYLVHRDPRWWTDPETFNPHRWMTDEPPHARHAYFPFGAGPRICVGNQLGMLELTVVISRLAHKYDIEVTNLDSAPMSPKTVLTPGGLRARFSPADRKNE